MKILVSALILCLLLPVTAPAENSSRGFYFSQTSARSKPTKQVERSVRGEDIPAGESIFRNRKPVASEDGESAFNPDLHRQVLQKNADRAATIERVTRNPRKFQGIQIFYSGRVEEIRERGLKRPVTYLHCTDGQDRFVCRVQGSSDRFSRGMIIECYGRISRFRQPFKAGDAPVIEAIRVLTPQEAAADHLREKDLNLILAARSEGGLLTYGRKLQADGKLRDALFALSVALDYEPSSPRAEILYSRAEVRLALGRSEDAMADLNACLYLTTTEGRHRFLRGRIYLAQGLYEHALRDLEPARKLVDGPAIRAAIVESHDRAGQPEEALQCARQAREDGLATDPELCRRAAYLAAMLGWPAEAADWLEFVLSAFPGETNLVSEINSLRALAAIATGEKKRKASAAEAAILESALQTLGHEFVPLQVVVIPAGLESRLEELCRQRVDDSDPWQYLARIALLNHQGDTARALLKEALRREKNRPYLWWDAGWAAYFSNKPDDAISFFQTALRLNPRMSRAARAAEMIQALIRLQAWRSDDHRTQAHLTYGNLLQTKGQHEDARFQYSEGLRTAPNHPDLLFNLAWLNWRAGNSTEAETLLRKLFRLHPGNSRYAEHLRRLGFDELDLQSLGFRPGARP